MPFLNTLNPENSALLKKKFRRPPGASNPMAPQNQISPPPPYKSASCALKMELNLADSKDETILSK